MSILFHLFHASGLAIQWNAKWAEIKFQQHKLTQSLLWKLQIFKTAFRNSLIFNGLIVCNRCKHDTVLLKLMLRMVVHRRAVKWRFSVRIEGVDRSFCLMEFFNLFCLSYTAVYPIRYPVWWIVHSRTHRHLCFLKYEREQEQKANTETVWCFRCRCRAIPQIRICICICNKKPGHRIRCSECTHRQNINTRVHNGYTLANSILFRHMSTKLLFRIRKEEFYRTVFCQFASQAVVKGSNERFYKFFSLTLAKHWRYPADGRLKIKMWKIILLIKNWLNEKRRIGRIVHVVNEEFYLLI